jgi:hypothetical protein
MPDRTWVTPVGNTLDAVKPVPTPPGDHANICNAWTGGTVYQERGEIALAANGGHGDYNGNEVYVCGLRTANPVWTRLTDPSPSSGGSDARQSSGQWGDGRMRPVHGWHRCVCDRTGKIWYAGQDGMTTSGNWTTATHSFNRELLGNGPFPVPYTSAPWTYHGLGLADAGGTYYGEAGVATYDRNRHWVWSLGGNGAPNGLGQHGFTVDCATGQLTPRSMPNGGGRWTAHVWDLDLWITGDPYPSNLDICFLDCKTPAAGFTRRKTTGASFPREGAGCVYHQPSRALICWNNSGATIKVIRIPANPYSGAWIVEDVPAAGGNTVVPSAAPGNGTYSRFNIIEDMGDGQSALTIVNSTRGPVYVYKLPRAGI